MNTEAWSQKKLKVLHIIFLALRLVVEYVLPVILCITFAYQGDMVKETSRLPLVVSIIAIAVLGVGFTVLAKQVDRISVLNLDGSYKTGTRWLKHILQGLCKCIFPLGALIALASFNTWLDKCQEYANSAILSISICWIAGELINSILVKACEEELDIRDKLAESNAVERRKNLLTK